MTFEIHRGRKQDERAGKQVGIQRVLPGCRIVLTACLMAYLSACAREPVISGQGLGWAVARGDPPRKVAVLPFSDRSHTEGLANLVRTSFYSRLSALTFIDLELFQVDDLLKAHGLVTNERISQTPVKELGRILGADAIIFGEVTEFDRVFAGLYSQLSVGAAITIYDTRSGEKLWADSHVSRFHEGALPFDILSIPLITMRSGFNLRETVKVRVVDELCRELIVRIPAPPGAVAGNPEQGVYAYEVQAGAFLDENRAREFSETLRGKGFPAAFIRRHRNGLELWHRVILGPYLDREEAQQVLEKIHLELSADAYTYRVPLPPK